MLKLLLVDDEPITRKGIITTIDWEKLGIEIVGEASNGLDAMDKALELKPHIVITDIRMPIMDGLALSASLKAQLPDTRIIILSGYDDFAYAKEAVRHGVYEYLLKPVGAEDLIMLVTKLCSEIIKNEAQKTDHLSANYVFNENYPYLKSNFINKIIKGEYTQLDAIYEKAMGLKLKLTAAEFIVFTIDIDDFVMMTEDMSETNKQLLPFSVMNIAEELMHSKVGGLVCYSEFEHLIGLINTDNISPAVMNEICEEIQLCLKKYLKLSVSIGIGTSYKSILDISQSYLEALAALRSKIYKGKSSIIHFQAAAESQMPISILYPSEEEKAIIHHLKTLNMEGLKATIDQLFSGFSPINSTAESIRALCSRLIVISISSIEEMGIQIHNSLGADFNPYKEADKYEVLQDLQMWLLSCFQRMLVLIQDNKTLKFKSIIKIALKYMEENYHKDLSLGDIASVVYVTPNYLSRVFKEEMNINFVSWLNQFRVEKAKALLSEASAKTYEVAEKVGYRDYKYFSYIFKKNTGYTPKEYKEKHCH